LAAARVVALDRPAILPWVLGSDGEALIVRLGANSEETP
jgi:hypothetical protein